jgi:GT2 family glycosyltransferase
MTTTAVCIVNYNTCDHLRLCLRSVLVQRPDEIIVADNASTDGSADMVKTEFPSVKFIALNRNLGYGAAANRAVENCRAEHVLLLNSDTVVKTDALNILCQYLEAHDSPLVIGPRILNPNGMLQTSCFHFPSPLHIFLYLSGFFKLIPRLPILGKRTLQGISDPSPRVVPWVLGAALIFRRETFTSLGGFDESFFMYFEEVDLCQRLSTLGGQVHFVPAAEIVHTGGVSTEPQRVRMTVQYFASLAHFYRKHYSRLLLTELIVMVKFVAVLQLAHDALLLQFTRDGTKRAALKMNMEIQQNLLLGQWDRRTRHGGLAPA